MQRPARILVVAALAALLAGLFAGCAADPVVELADPETFEAVYAWTTGEANAAAREYLTQLHADGASLHGESRVSSVAPMASTPVTSLAVCLDVQEVHLLDATGESMVDDSRPDKQSFEVGFILSRNAPHGLQIEVFRGGDPSRCG